MLEWHCFLSNSFQGLFFGVTGIVVKPVEGTLLNMTSVMLYNCSNDVQNNVLYCHCTKIMHSGVFDLQEEKNSLLRIRRL